MVCTEETVDVANLDDKEHHIDTSAWNYVSTNNIEKERFEKSFIDKVKMMEEKIIWL